MKVMGIELGASRVAKWKDGYKVVALTLCEGCGREDREVDLATGLCAPCLKEYEQAQEAKL